MKLQIDTRYNIGDSLIWQSSNGCVRCNVVGLKVSATLAESATVTATYLVKCNNTGSTVEAMEKNLHQDTTRWAIKD